MRDKYGILVHLPISCFQGYPIKTLGVRPADPPMLKGTGDRLATWLTYVIIDIAQTYIMTNLFDMTQ